MKLNTNTIDTIIRQEVVLPKEKHSSKGYFLGINSYNEFVYLQKPSFDCDWYWGFGYIQTYKYKTSRDFEGHSHWDSEIVGKTEQYDSEKQAWVLSEHKHHLRDNKNWLQFTITEKESWELADLMQSYYTLKKVAEIYHTGISGLTSGKLSLKDSKQEHEINTVTLPAIFQRIDEILSPKLNK